MLDDFGGRSGRVPLPVLFEVVTMLVQTLVAMVVVTIVATTVETTVSTVLREDHTTPQRVPL